MLGFVSQHVDNVLNLNPAVLSLPRRIVFALYVFGGGLHNFGEHVHVLQ